MQLNKPSSKFIIKIRYISTKETSSAQDLRRLLLLEEENIYEPNIIPSFMSANTNFQFINQK